MEQHFSSVIGPLIHEPSFGIKGEFRSVLLATSYRRLCPARVLLRQVREQIDMPLCLC
jgi:hypothetical protein